MPLRAFGRSAIFVLLLSFTVLPAFAQETIDEEAVAAIRAHGLEDSQVMDLMSWLTDVHGPRLTGSPQLRAASEWAVEKMQAWGLENAHLEPWGPFGRGWTLDRFSMHATGAVSFPVHAYPKAWSSGTDGVVSGEVVLFDAKSADDLARFEGKLAGKIVLVDEPREVDELFEPEATRRDAENLLALSNAGPASEGGRSYSQEALRRYREQQRLRNFVLEQNPLAVLDRSSKGDYGTIFVSGAAVATPEGAGRFDGPSARDAGTYVVPQITVAVEHYNRMARLLQKGLPLSITLDLAVTYHEDDPMEHNVIAEIPGTDPDLSAELVMLGGHLDSWHAGTGATDNAAGCAVMMEAVRILQQVYAETGTRPRRTIRIALWTGEEQGLFGSRAYVNDHFAELEGWGGPPSALKPDHERFSAYYNLDNGTGKIRGVYLQGNEAVRPIFRAWLAPFADLGASTLSLSNTGGTDHLPFDAAGLPGFQFIQEPIAYGTRTHHSNMDVYDHAVADDLKQAATIIASFVYHTAQRDEKLPRKPLVMETAEEATVGSN